MSFGARIIALTPNVNHAASVRRRLEDNQTAPNAQFSELPEQRAGDSVTALCSSQLRLSWMPVQACGLIPTIWSRSIPSLDWLSDLSRRWASACCLLRMGHRSAERSARL